MNVLQSTTSHFYYTYFRFMVTINAVTILTGGCKASTFDDRSDADAGIMKMDVEDAKKMKVDIFLKDIRKGFRF